MVYLGLLNKNKTDKRNGSQGYIRRNGQQITFRWLNDTTAALLDMDKDDQILEKSSNITTEKCLFENNIKSNNFSENLQIRAFDSHKTYYDHDDKSAPKEGNIEKCQKEQLACKDRSRCIKERWICDDLEDCEDKTDEEFEFCNKRAGCCWHGVIFNSKQPERNRFKILGESASQAIGVYNRKNKTSDKRIEYVKNTETQSSQGTQLTLDWDDNSWIVSKYHNATNNEQLWIGPPLEKTDMSPLNDRCVNQNHSTAWKYLLEEVARKSSSSEKYTNFDMVAKCLDPTVFWKSEVVMDETFLKTIPDKADNRSCEKADDFACDNGEQCVFSLHVWDGIFDCSDKSDERPGKDHGSHIKNSVNIQKKIYIDKKEKRLRINVSIAINTTRFSEAYNRNENGRVIGLSLIHI